MKKYILLGQVLLLLFFAVPRAMAAPVEVYAGGHGSGPQAEQQAAEDIRFWAVKRALLRVVTVDVEKDSLCQQILQQYGSFAGKVIVEEKRQNAQGMDVTGHVAVDIDKIRSFLQQRVDQERKKDIDSRVMGFFVRVIGLPDGEQEKAAEQIVLQRYNNAFQALGFSTADEDGTLSELPSYCQQDYSAFRQAMEARLSEHVEVTLAVIGEIQLVPGMQDAAGASIGSRVHIEVVDYVRNKKVASFDDAYEIRRANPSEAQRFILEKAAFNSSKELAAQTMLYWQRR